MKKNKKLTKLALGLGTVATIAAPIAAVVSCGSSSTGNVFNQGRRTLIEYQSVDSFAGESNRAWDMSVQAKTPNSRTIWDMTMTTLVKQRVTQSSEVTTDKAGNQTVTKKKIEKWTLDGAGTVAISQDNGTSFNESTTDGNQLMDNIVDKGVNAYKFTVPSGVHYIGADGKETKYEYKAIDYLYGFLRNLYTTEEVRLSSSIKGVDIDVPKMEADYQQKIATSEEWSPGGKLNTDEYDNGNAYLLNLFGVDIKGTIEANTGANENDDQFILKMKDTKKDTAFVSAILGSTNIFTPVSSQKIQELSGLTPKAEFKEPGKYLQLLEFGAAPRTNGVADLSGTLTVGKYYFSKYDTRADRNGGEGIIIQKNPYGANKEYAEDDSTLLKFVTFVHGQTDEDTFAQARQRSFLADNSESILYTSVKEKASLMEPIKSGDYARQFISSKSGGLSQGLMNPYYMINGKQKLNDDTSQLLFGANVADVNASEAADDEYFFGRGRQFRALLNTSVNLYSLTKVATPEAVKFKTARDYESGQPISTSEADGNFGGDEGIKASSSIGSISDSEGEEIYSNNIDNIGESLKPGDAAKIQALKDSWKKFFDKAKIDNQNLGDTSKFEFPLYDYRASDGTETPGQVTAWKELVKYLNTLTTGNNITFVEFDKSSGDKETNIINKFKTAPFVYSGAGADYPSVSSLVQQYLSATYGYSIAAELLKSSIKNPSATQDLDANYGLTGTTDFSDIWAFINDASKSGAKLLLGDKDDVEKTLGSITLQDWIDYRVGELTGDKLDLLNEIDNVFQKFFLSIAGNKDQILKWTKFMSNLNIGDKLAIGYPSYSAATTPILSGADATTAKIPVGTTYSQPWIHLAEIPSTNEVQENYVDLKIDSE